MPPFPEVSNGTAAHAAFFFSTPGSVHRATRSGTWGDAREATAEYGEEYLAFATDSTVGLLDDIERTFAAMPPR
jgi:creatinine amidohydrolase/Fe(II)-dependent formamide hydrolase-like protein